MTKVSDGGALGKALSAFLFLALAGAVALLIYSVGFPASGEKFTEFYILNAHGQAAAYPTELKVGQAGTVLVGIVNREKQPVTYRVEVVLDDEVTDRLGPLPLADGQKFEQAVSFAFEEAGERQKVEFRLYREGQPDAYQTLYLFINVTE